MRRIEVIASIVVVVLVVLGGLLVLRPFISAILWAAVLCYCTWAGFLRLDRALNGRRKLAAGIMTTLVSFILVVPFIVVGVTLANNVSRMGEWFRFVKGGLPDDIPENVAALPVIGERLTQSWPDIVKATDHMIKVLQANALASGHWFLQHAIDFALGIAQLVVSMLVAYLFYCEGERVVERIVVGGRRLLGDSIQQHVNVIGKTIRSVVYGILGTAMVQGILAGLGFWIAGLPSPFLLGLITLGLAVLPMGPLLIWVPASLWLFMNGEVGWAVFMALWGLIAINGIEHFIKPYFIMQGTNLPFVVILFGVVGGVVAFGFIGLFLGPVLLAVGYQIAREFTEVLAVRGKAKAAAPAPEPPVDVSLS